MTEAEKALDLLYDYAHSYADVSHQHQSLGALIEARDTIRASLIAAEATTAHIGDLLDVNEENIRLKAELERLKKLSECKFTVDMIGNDAFSALKQRTLKDVSGIYITSVTWDGENPVYGERRPATPEDFITTPKEPIK